MQPESHSPGFHPPPDRQTDLLVLQCELMSAGWECSLYFLTSSSILFSPFSQSNDLPLTSLACVWGHWLSEDATCGHQSDGWILAVSFSWSRVFFSPPSAALHMFRQSRVLVKNECWMEKQKQHLFQLTSSEKYQQQFLFLALQGSVSIEKLVVICLV